jgi:hypothetical protein
MFFSIYASRSKGLCRLDYYESKDSTLKKSKKKIFTRSFNGYGPIVYKIRKENRVLVLNVLL